MNWVAFDGKLFVFAGMFLGFVIGGLIDRRIKRTRHPNRWRVVVVAISATITALLVGLAVGGRW